MDYDAIEKGFQAFLVQSQVFTPSQLRRLVQVSSALVLAGRCQVRQLARWLRRQATQPSRMQWLRRLLDADFLQPDYAYEPVLQGVLSRNREAVWHIIMDRTHVVGWDEDVVMLSLSYRKRSLPLVWVRIRPGRATTECVLRLLERSLRLIPSDVQVIFQRDSEFAHVAILRWLRDHGWDFIGGQSGQRHFWYPGQEQSQALNSLTLKPGQHRAIAHALIGQQHPFGDVNLYLFYQPHRCDPSQPSREVEYVATSLPLSRLIKTLGKRRWGIECLFQDWKSAGWDIEASYLEQPKRRDSLLTLLALAYLWLTLIGRWLCKTGQRRLVDNQPKRHLSLFHIGWDWLIFQSRCGRDSPHLSTLSF